MNTESQRQLLSIQCELQVNELRMETLAGQEHTVVPCVALVEGVLTPGNASGPELALASEFGHTPATWDGRPVILGHAYDSEGNAISANAPSVLNEQAFGQIFNTELDDKKLRTEIWINNARVENLGGDIKDAVDRLTSDDDNVVVEVSTGLFSINEATEGVYDGEAYQSVWRNVIPDHLAVLPEGMIGACSVADGCGAPRVNSSSSSSGDAPASSEPLQPGTGVARSFYLAANGCSCEATKVNDDPDAEGTKVNDDTEVALDLTEQQKSLFKRFKELLGMKTDFGPPDLRQAIQERVETRGYIHDLHVLPLDGEDLETTINSGQAFYLNNNRTTLYRRTYEVEDPAADPVRINLSDEEPYIARRQYVRLDVNPAGVLVNNSNTEYAIKDNNREISDADVSAALNAALAHAGEYAYVMAIYQGDDGSGTVIWWDYWTDSMFAQDFTVGSAGAVTLATNKTAVRPVTQFVPLEVNFEGEETQSESEMVDNNDDPAETDPTNSIETTEQQPMDKEAVVDALIANEGTHFTAADKEALMGIDVDVLKKLAPHVFADNSNNADGGEVQHTVETNQTADTGTTVTATVTNTGTVVAVPTVHRAQTVEEYLDAAPEGVREVLMGGLKAQSDKKQGLIKGLLDAATNPFSEDELKTKSITELENLSALANVVTYQGAAAGSADSGAQVDNDAPPAPPSILSALKKNAA